MRQTSFPFIGEFTREFGGSLLVGKRKTARPLSTKEPIHLILKSTNNRFFSPGDRRIENVFHKQARKYGIKIYRISLNWNHIHLVIKLRSFDDYKAFIRIATAKLVRLISRIRGIKLKRLFDLRPFTKIISWGRQFKTLLEYHDLNDMEAFGMIKREKKKKTKKPKRS